MTVTAPTIAKIADIDRDTHFRIGQFLFREADLLDSGEWERWNDLFAEDGIYWVPSSADQHDGIDQVSLAYDDALLRAIRVARQGADLAASLRAPVSSSRMIGNLMASHEEAQGFYIARSRFSMAQYADWGTRTFHGSYTHYLRPVGDDFRIVLKRVDLVNIQGSIGDILTIL